MPEGTTRTPTTVTLKYFEKTEAIVDQYSLYTFYVTGDQYLALPLDANVRLPSDKTVPYREMSVTLEKKPKTFFLQNSGISVIAGSLRYIGKDMVELVFPPGTGIVNGGHTQLALLAAKDEYDISQVRVKLEVLKHTFTPEELALIAASRNTASNVKPYSTAEKKGLFAPIKQAMSPDYEKHIIWFENREVPNDVGYSSVDLIALINLFSIVDYQSQLDTSNNDQPNKSATSKSAVFADWEAERKKNFAHLYPLVDDIINLLEHIETSFDVDIPRGFTRLEVVKNVQESKRRTLFTGKSMRFEMPKQFLLPLLAAFRANVRYDADKKEIGWYENPETVFNSTKSKLIEALLRTYKSTYHAEINRASKDQNLWQILYLIVEQSVDKSQAFKMYAVGK